MYGTIVCVNDKQPMSEFPLKTHSHAARNMRCKYKCRAMCIHVRVVVHTNASCLAPNHQRALFINKTVHIFYTLSCVGWLVEIACLCPFGPECFLHTKRAVNASRNRSTTSTTTTAFVYARQELGRAFCERKKRTTPNMPNGFFSSIPFNQNSNIVVRHQR